MPAEVTLYIMHYIYGIYDMVQHTYAPCALVRLVKKYLCSARFNFLLNKNRKRTFGTNTYARQTRESGHMCTVVGGGRQVDGGVATCKPNPGAATETKSEATALTFNGGGSAHSEMQNCGRRLQAAPKGAHKSFTLTYHTHRDTHMHSHTHTRAHTIAFKANAKQQNKTKLPRAKAKAEAKAKASAGALFTLTAAGHSKCI